MEGRVALALLALGACAADPVRVVEVLDPAGARLSDAELHEALQAAADLMRVYGGRELRFDLAPVVVGVERYAGSPVDWTAALAAETPAVLVLTNVAVAPVAAAGRALVSLAPAFGPGPRAARAAALMAHGLARAVLAAPGCLGELPADLATWSETLRARPDCRR